MTIQEISAYLETYDLLEILELNGLTEEDVLLFLVEQKLVKLPDYKPLDFENEY